jgi:hypothetical protein
VFACNYLAGLPSLLWPQEKTASDELIKAWSVTGVFVERLDDEGRAALKGRRSGREIFTALEDLPKRRASRGWRRQLARRLQ